MNVFVLTGGAQQILNALEARVHFELGRADTRLLATPAVWKTGLVDEAQWSRVDVVSLRWVGRRVLGSVGAAGFAAQVLGRLDGLRPARLFIGHYGDAMRTIAAVAGPCEVLLLDDGVATLDAARGRLAGRTTASWLKRGLGLKTQHPERLTFFTSFDVEHRREDQVVRNDYKGLRSRIRAAVGDDVVFLGQPLCSSLGVSPARYESWVAHCRTLFAGRVLYKPHRAEDSGDVRALAGRVGVDVVDSPLPFEAWCAARPAPPAVVVSVVCSALLTAKKIFGTAMRVIALRPPDVDLGSARDRVAAIYASFAGGGVEIIDVGN